MRLSSVVVVNRSRTFEGRRALALDRIVRAVQTQVERDFAPAWGFAPLAVLSVQDGEPVPLGAALVYLVSSIDDAPGAAGIHKSDPRGFFTGCVAVDAIARLGGSLWNGPDSVSSALSHEVLELIANPTVTLWCDDGGSKSFAREVCDPVSGETYDIEIEPLSGERTEPIAVSNFVHPDWFNPHATSGLRLDQLGTTSSPFEIRPSGYAVTRSLLERASCVGEARATGGRRVGHLVGPQT